MFKLKPREFDFTQGNENPLALISLTTSEVYSLEKEELLNFIVFNHNKKEFYISRTNVATRRLYKWCQLLTNQRSVVGIPDVLYYSFTKECFKHLCIAVTIDNDATINALAAMEHDGWTELSKSSSQTRVREKTTNLYMVTDTFTGFTRYTMSACPRDFSIMENIRSKTAILSNNTSLGNISGRDIITAELVRIYKESFYCRVKTTKITQIKEKEFMNAPSGKYARQIMNLNEIAMQDWLASEYVKNLVNKEGVLNREA